MSQGTLGLAEPTLTDEMVNYITERMQRRLEQQNPIKPDHFGSVAVWERDIIEAGGGKADHLVTLWAHRAAAHGRGSHRRGRRTLAALALLNPDTVRRRNRDLVAWGLLVERGKRPGRSNPGAKRTYELALSPPLFVAEIIESTARCDRADRAVTPRGSAPTARPHRAVNPDDGGDEGRITTTITIEPKPCIDCGKPAKVYESAIGTRRALDRCPDCYRIAKRRKAPKDQTVGRQPPPPYDPDRPLTPLEAAYARGEID